MLVQLPKQLPSRLTTLQQACPEATFAANPYNCPGGSFVGGVRANTPVLSGKLKGPAILVSHADAAFPDLDLVLETEGVRVILVGNTNIKNAITTTSFATLPDVPVSSITVNLPIGGHSALAGNGNLCASSLVMPTTITGQNGFQVKQNTKMSVLGCGVRIVGEKVIGNTAYITVQTFEAGRISGSGPNLASDLPVPGQGRENRDAQGFALARGPRQGPPAEGPPAGGIRAQEAGRRQVRGIPHGDVPVAAPGLEAPRAGIEALGHRIERRGVEDEARCS